jgi:antitoxin component YwqK of YwqJK toxin-antitoxin module
MRTRNVKKDGLFVNYWDNGNKEQEGSWKDDKKWTSYVVALGWEKLDRWDCGQKKASPG